MSSSLIQLSLKQLITSEAFIGEKSQYRHYKNTQNILATRNNTDIINVEKTLQNIEPLIQLITNTVANYEQILVVAQHPSAEPFVKDFPQPLLTKSWVHGAFSNFKVIRNSKKKTLFSSLNRLPNLVILLHTYNNQIILNECKYLGIPTVAFLDTADNPGSNLYVIPTNNKSDAIIKLYLQIISKAVFFGYAKRILNFNKKN